MSYESEIALYIGGLGFALGFMAVLMATEAKTKTAVTTISRSFFRMQHKRQHRTRDQVRRIAQRASCSLDTRPSSQGIDQQALSIVREISQRLIARHGERVAGVYLFGSRARGDYEADSDIDVAIRIAPDISPGLRIYYSGFCIAFSIMLRTGMYVQIRILHGISRKTMLYEQVLDREGLSV